MDTADNRNYGLPRRGGTKGCSTAKDRTGTSFDNLTFYGPEGRETGLQSLPFPSLAPNRGEKEALCSSFLLPPHVTNSRLRLSRFYRPNIPTDALSFSFPSYRPIIYFLLSTILLKVFFRAGRIFLVHRHSLGQSFITSSRDFNRDQSRVCFSC